MSADCWLGTCEALVADRPSRLTTCVIGLSVEPSVAAHARLTGRGQYATQIAPLVAFPPMPPGISARSIGEALLTAVANLLAANEIV